MLCARRVRRGHQLLLRRVWEIAFFEGFFGFSLVPCAYGRCLLCWFTPFVYKASVTSVCLLLDTPFGRRSVVALPL